MPPGALIVCGFIQVKVQAGVVSLEAGQAIRTRLQKLFEVPGG